MRHWATKDNLSPNFEGLKFTKSHRLTAAVFVYKPPQTVDTFCLHSLFFPRLVGASRLYIYPIKFKSYRPTEITTDFVISISQQAFKIAVITLCAGSFQKQFAFTEAAICTGSMQTHGPVVPHTLITWSLFLYIKSIFCSYMCPSARGSQPVKRLSIHRYINILIPHQHKHTQWAVWGWVRERGRNKI